jgi:integrase/recombinase XerD
MPVDVGAAVAAYLQRRRPGSKDRHLFWGRSPIRRLKQGALGTIEHYVLPRAQVEAPHHGSHQFRHALAGILLQGGGSLRELVRSCAIKAHRAPRSMLGGCQCIAFPCHAVAGRCAMNTLREALEE